ncbi:pyridoxamine 5'-phosphate oxidase family protein [Streptomonospora litoralis]|uniref:Pyridoxamine 5'-phosphate oxidase n=1 Tax=Streptomonospora litoralis TaxID=2498135 RepID=A0A4P6Q1Q5_9ACTN|nr:pyridoxamine 5'-phosphate oxidase family protein [Streptomonospora litoralis]QBI54566.1 Pyridoxamine 5'-phosphate oxidase [Streptomonospora litoralis]
MAVQQSPHDADYPATPRTTPARKADRVGYDRTGVHAVLDADYICHVGFVADGAPVVLPMLYARVAERLYLHGSTGARALHSARDGLRVCVTVTLADGIVLARSAVHHSVNYRSVVAHGVAHRVGDAAECRTALDALIDAPFPGRSADCRPADSKELAKTAVLRLDLREVSAKVRSGGVNEEPGDRDLPHWAGVVPARRAYGPPVPDTGSPGPLPHYLRGLPA